MTKKAVPAKKKPVPAPTDEAPLVEGNTAIAATEKGCILHSAPQCLLDLHCVVQGRTY